MDMHFKTSHVIVYPGILGNMQNESYDFKTSHVIVYPREYEKCGTVHGISKHLMLLFIF